MAHLVGVVATLRRYPVKSMGGETCGVVDLDHRGVLGDRLYAVRDGDGKLGSGKNTRRFRSIEGLVHLAARYDSRYDSEVPVVTLPDATEVSGADGDVHARLSGWLGLDVHLVRESGVPHLDEAPIHVVTSASLARLRAVYRPGRVDERRLRPNIVIRTDPTVPPGFVEDGWVGGRLRVGSALLEVTRRTERCVMVDQAREGLAAAPGLLRTVADANDLCVGAYARIVTPGTLHRGDRVVLEW